MDEKVLKLEKGQSIAYCPYCKGELSKKTPMLSGYENEIIENRSHLIMMIADPRPKCPHCYGRFSLEISF
jgi:hypothetical protein